MKWLLKICFVLPSFRMSHGAVARHLEVLQLAHSHSQASTHSRASSRALAGFQKYTDELVDDYLRTGETPNRTDLREAISIIEKYIWAEHQTALSAHGFDMEVDGCGGHVQECIDSFFKPTHIQHMVNMTTIIGTERSEHSACRQNQVTCCGHMQGNCTIYNNYRRFWHEDSGNTPYPGIDPNNVDFPNCYETDLIDDYIRTDVETTRKTMESCLEKVYNWHLPMYQKYLACKNNADCCEDVNDECKAHQKDFEHAHCVGYDYINDHCDSGRECFQNRIATCNADFCDQIQRNVEVRKAGNETGMRILCLLNVLENVSSDEMRNGLEACKRKDYYEEQAFWNITCDASGAPSWPGDLDGICPNQTQSWYPTAIPCDDYFTFTEYLNKWTGLSPSCVETCPGHNNNITRNTTFVIHTDRVWSRNNGFS